MSLAGELSDALVSSRFRLADVVAKNADYIINAVRVQEQYDARQAEANKPRVCKCGNEVKSYSRRIKRCIDCRAAAHQKQTARYEKLQTEIRQFGAR